MENLATCLIPPEILKEGKTFSVVNSKPEIENYSHVLESEDGYIILNPPTGIPAAEAYKRIIYMSESIRRMNQSVTLLDIAMTISEVNDEIESDKDKVYISINGKRMRDHFIDSAPTSKTYLDSDYVYKFPNSNMFMVILCMQSYPNCINIIYDGG